MTTYEYHVTAEDMFEEAHIFLACNGCLEDDVKAENGESIEKQLLTLNDKQAMQNIISDLWYSFQNQMEWHFFNEINLNDVASHEHLDPDEVNWDEDDFEINCDDIKKWGKQNGLDAADTDRIVEEIFWREAQFVADELKTELEHELA